MHKCRNWGVRGGQGPQYFSLETLLIFIHAVQIDTCLMHVMAASTSLLLTSFVKSTTSIGCVSAESNVQVYSNAEEPTRPYIDYFWC